MQKTRVIVGIFGNIRAQSSRSCVLTALRYTEKKYLYSINEIILLRWQYPHFYTAADKIRWRSPRDSLSKQITSLQ